MGPPGARYDGHADWYDHFFSPFADSPEMGGLLSDLLGQGEGQTCLDIACGTGLHAGEVTAAGYRPVGIDLSADQLRLARTRLPCIARADAGRLPVKSGSVSRAVGMFFHTDVEDFGAILAEGARCLAPGGRFVYVGLHPCFIGPFCVRTSETEDQRLIFEPGYGRRGWAYRGSGGGTGLWARVGGHHKTLAEFLTAFADAGLCIRRVIELGSGGTMLPRNIALAADKLP